MNTWRCQFAISAWHQDLDIGPTRLLMSPWYRHDNGRYPAKKKSSRIVYHFSISHNNATFILRQMKIKASGGFFLSCCYETFEKYFQTTLLYLKVISNIASGETAILCTSWKISTTRYSKKVFHRCFSSILYKIEK